jgi:pectinesterase
MKKIFFLISLPVLLFAQDLKFPKEIPRDTSFSTANTKSKILQKYPFAKPVISKLPEEVSLNENVVYEVFGERELHLDLFGPVDKSKGSFPAVLIIHGGGWRSGDRKMEWPTAQHLAASGYVTATVEYRLSPEALYPAGIYDLKAEIRWLRTNAEKYNIDPHKIAVSGCSAGGELAAFLGTTGNLVKFEGNGGNKNISTRVQAVIDVDGIVDFTHPAESNKDNDPAKSSAGKAWFGYSYKENPIPWVEASPMNYVNEKTPPFLFINSSLPQYHAGRDYMIEKMNIFKIYSEVRTIQDTPHPFWLFHPWFDEYLGYMVNFLDKILKGK